MAVCLATLGVRSAVSLLPTLAVVGSACRCVNPMRAHGGGAPSEQCWSGLSSGALSHIRAWVSGCPFWSSATFGSVALDPVWRQGSRWFVQVPCSLLVSAMRGSLRLDTFPRSGHGPRMLKRGPVLRTLKAIMCVQRVFGCVFGNIRRAFGRALVPDVGNRGFVRAAA